MKKLIAILAIMIVIVGAVFAASNDKVVLSSTVSKVSPNFKIYLGDEAGTSAGATVEIEEDISEDNVLRTFIVKQADNLVIGTQSTTKNYSKFKGTATITVEIDAFRNTTLNAASSIYEITSATSGDGVTGKLEIADATIATDKHSAEAVLTYKGKKILDSAAGTLLTVNAKWTADDTLPVFDKDTEKTVYTADVKLTYTVQ